MMSVFLKTTVTEKHTTMSAQKTLDSKNEINKTTMWLQRQLPIIRRMFLSEKYRKNIARKLS